MIEQDQFPELRQHLAVPDGERDPDTSDLLVVLAAMDIVRDEGRRIYAVLLQAEALVDGADIRWHDLD